MAGISFRYDVQDAAVQRRFDGLLAKAENLSDAMDEIGAALVSSTLDRFDAGRGPDGKPWTPSKRAVAQHGKTLVDQGHLRDSITHVAGRGTVEVGTNMVYARIHQLGGTTQKYAASMPVYRRQSDIRAGISRFVKRSQSDFMSYHTVGAHSITMPARPYLGISSSDEDEIAAILTEHLMGLD